MRVRNWSTVAEFHGIPLDVDGLVHEKQEIVIRTDLTLNGHTTLEFQRLAWRALAVVRPDWVPPGHIHGLAKAPKGDQWLTDPMITLTHEYQEL